MSDYKYFTLIQVEKQKSAKGTYRRLWYNDKQFYACFEDGIYDKIDELEGQKVKALISKNGKYENVTNIWPANSDGPADSQPSKSYTNRIDGSSGPTGNQYKVKDYSIIQQSQMERAVSIVAPLYQAQYAADPKSFEKNKTAFIGMMVDDILTAQKTLFDKVWGAIEEFRKENAGSPADGGATYRAGTNPSYSDNDIPFGDAPEK